MCVTLIVSIGGIVFELRVRTDIQTHMHNHHTPIRKGRQLHDSVCNGKHVGRQEWPPPMSPSHIMIGLATQGRSTLDNIAER